MDWKLITDLPVHSHDDAVEKLGWYAMRRKIETIHKILKSGCKAEEARLRTAERLVKLIAVFCILAWRVFWMTMINRTTLEAKPELAITEGEMKLLDQLLRDKDSATSRAGLVLLSDQECQAGRLSGARQRSAAGKHRHVARPFAPHRH